MTAVDTAGLRAWFEQAPIVGSTGTVARVEALRWELGHPDVDLIVPIERAHRRTVGYELGAALEDQ